VFLFILFWVVAPLLFAFPFKLAQEIWTNHNEEWDINPEPYTETSGLSDELRKEWFGS